MALASTKNIMEKIGNVLFVHGGISRDLLSHNLSITEINNLARQYYLTANKAVSGPFVCTLCNNNNSPLWYCGHDQQLTNEDIINAVMGYFGVATIVTGHTVAEKVSGYFNGKVINVNTDQANGKLEALLSKAHRFYRVNGDGIRERIK